MGWLARHFGLACDNVARFEVVSANGEILHASQSQNPDLFRGLRGGTAPAAERTQELTYLQLQAIDDIPQAPCQRRYWKGHYLREFGDEAIGAFVLTRARTECGAPTALARCPGSPR